MVADGFNTDGVIPAHWKLYKYGYRSSPACTAPENVSVSGGYLRLLMSYRTSKPPLSVCSYRAGWYTGSMALKKVAPYAAVDQRVTVRWRVVPNGVTSHRIIPMRWPASVPPSGNHGEEDWCEGRSNSSCSTFLHRVNPNGTISTVRKAYTVDLTQWHTMRAEKIGYVTRFYIDDMVTPVWTYTGTEASLPSRSRVVVFHMQCPTPAAGGCPSGTTGSEEIQIDYVLVDNLR